MKKIIITGVVLILGVGGSYIYFDGGEVQAENVIKEYVDREVVREVPSNERELDRRTREAIIASSTEIEQVSQQASDDKRMSMESEIRLEVIRQMKAELIELEEQEEEKVSL
jgi:hypothetical protein